MLDEMRLFTAFLAYVCNNIFNLKDVLELLKQAGALFELYFYCVE